MLIIFHVEVLGLFRTHVELTYELLDATGKQKFEDVLTNI
jgi:hypothetical protein